jgi:hypothetical protein
LPCLSSASLGNLGVATLATGLVVVVHARYPY